MNYEIGQTVYADFGLYSSIDVKSGKIIKITPTGQMTVDFGSKTFDGKPVTRRFGADGRELGGGKWNRVNLIAESEFERRGKIQATRKAKRDLTEAAKALSFSTRAEAIEQVEALLTLAKAIPDDPHSIQRCPQGARSIAERDGRSAWAKD